jgi:NADPH:quinone reductase-like Zn-dependent oxidoreductase
VPSFRGFFDLKAITYHRYGPPEVLRVEEVAKPVPGPSDVVIRVRAVEATKADCEMRAFRFAVKWFWLPMRLAVGVLGPRRPVLGGYFAGVVDAVGRAVDDFAEGDEVFGSTGFGFGAYAEYLTLPARRTIVRKPAAMSFEAAAAVPLGGLNALHFMRRAGIRPGERVLINGAGGSIGTHAVQIAKSMGAEVTAVDAALKRTRLLDLGADRFIDYTREDFTTAPDCYDVIFDMVPGSPYGACIKRLGPNGRYLSGNPRLSFMLRSTITSRFTDKRAMFAFARESREELRALSQMIEAGQLRSIVDRVYPMERAAEAHRRVETEQRAGAVVITIRPKD